MPRSSVCSIALPPEPPATASHSGPLSRLQDRRAEQEVLHLLRLALHHLLDEVVDDVAVVPGEAGDEVRGVVAALHRQRGQLERGDPALGASLERRDVGRGRAAGPSRR